MKRIVTLCISIFLLTLDGCMNYQPNSFGSWDEIVVVGTREDWSRLRGTFSSVFERLIRTPRDEQIFKLYNIAPGTQFKRHKNIIIFGALKPENAGGEMVQEMLTPDVRQGVLDGNYYVFLRQDQWARDQQIMLLVAPTVEDLRQKMEENSEALFAMFDEWVASKLAERLFESGENKELEEYLFDTYGWTIRIARGYTVFEEDEENNLVWIRETQPERNIFIHWVPSRDGTELSSEWVLNTRNWLGTAYVDSMVIEEQFLEVSNSEFQERFAIHVQGLWKIPQRVMGGPFETWAFFHEEQNLIYFIDTMVFAPGEDKLPHLQRLSVMAKSFSTTPPKE